MTALVTLLTDFGTVDGYVGAMKGVICSLARDVRIVDLTHEVASQDVGAGAWALRVATGTFPTGTIHVAVVDPGVGTARRPLLLRAEGHLYLAPDNGLLSWVAGADDAEIWHLDRDALFRSPISKTFHGRDVFANVAGHLAAGRRAEDCGSTARSWHRLPWPTASVTSESIIGVVVHIDRFGNLISNIDAGDISRWCAWRVWVGGREVGPLRETFADVDSGRWVAYVGSGGAVELAVRDGSAAAHGGARGQEVRLCRIEG